MQRPRKHMWHSIGGINSVKSINLNPIMTLYWSMGWMHDFMMTFRWKREKEDVI